MRGSSTRASAELVTRGRTNQEVAEELQLSPKTIEWTLTNVYRKLRVRSRTELALTRSHSSGTRRLRSKRKPRGEGGSDDDLNSPVVE